MDLHMIFSDYTIYIHRIHARYTYMCEVYVCVCVCVCVRVCLYMCVALPIISYLIHEYFSSSTAPFP